MSTLSNPISIQVSGGAPAWFTSLAERTWTDIAGGSAYSGAAWQKGSRLSDVVPSPLPPGNGQNSIIKAWNAAVSLQSRGEYLKVAEGGHGDYYGNEIYALRLKDETPGWKRIWGPTPNAQITTTSIAYNDPAVRYGDGAPKTAHGWHYRQATETASGDRLWTLMTNAGGGGQWTTDCWSIPRASLDTGVTDASLWVYHGRLWTTVPGGSPQSSFIYQSGPSAFDSTGGRIMVAAEATAGGQGIREIDVETCVAAGMQSYAGNQTPGTTLWNVNPGDLSGSWSAVTTNTSPRCWIMASPDTNSIRVWNLESPGSVRTKTTTGANVSGTNHCGAAYHEGTNKIIIGEPVQVGATLRTLTIPSDPWNASSGFNWGTITNAGGTVSAQSGFAGGFSQFQMISDMGNGQACIVMHTRLVSQPTYVYKLPVTF